MYAKLISKEKKILKIGGHHCGARTYPMGCRVESRLLCFQLLANEPGEAEDGPRLGLWHPQARPGRLFRFLGSWPQPGPATATVTTSGVNQQTKRSSSPFPSCHLSFSLSLLLSVSSKKKPKKLKRPKADFRIYPVHLKNYHFHQQYRYS